MIRLIRHRPGAPGLRWGLGPNLQPRDAIGQLQRLFDTHSFWACGRDRQRLRRMLQGSQAVVSAWSGSRLVGFGRATSDGAYRAVLWDVMVAEEQQGLGLGRRIVEELIQAPGLAGIERTYLMTTNSQGFYEKLGFEANEQQKLMIKQINRWTK
ncbi:MULTISPECIES: GNAT family N-acetyltransferase [unclassified Synechococcus]|uniref:GNAT family N-acetyltransferase n=2 Tax=unclassified Synechococcus TaxID=2626047 RepID=UPI002AD3C25F|nr:MULTISPECIES: GNAT family N-acetyltransferase [unclassified Synechococcus]MEA5423134.1 GNAT family N-acetyltransferase [Synechococcus sp. CCY9202]CAK6702015.1 hypothetical protein IFHNHDMJ_03336 [Synechococcus sp. CBW1107]